MRSHSLLPACLVTLVAAAPLAGSAEDIASWRSVTVKAQPGKPFGAVTVSVELAGAGYESKIKSLVVKDGEKELAVPEAAYRGLRHIMLDRLRVSSEAGRGGEPLLYVSVVLGRP